MTSKWYNLKIVSGYWNENSDSCFRFNNPKQFSNWIILVPLCSSPLAIKNIYNVHFMKIEKINTKTFPWIAITYTCSIRTTSNSLWIAQSRWNWIPLLCRQNLTICLHYTLVSECHLFACAFSTHVTKTLMNVLFGGQKGIKGTIYC